MTETALIKVQTLSTLDVDHVHEVTRSCGYSILRGLVPSEEIQESKKLLRAWFDPNRDNASRGESPSVLEADFYQKFLVGATHQSGMNRPRCYRTIYFSLNFAERFLLRNTFTTLARVRNLVAGLPINYAINNDSDGFWTPARIHHYPKGGGFLVQHRDSFIPIVQQSGGVLSYAQPIVVMSRRGIDYSDGGGFVLDSRGERVYYEDYCELGDIILYTGDTIHGVEDVDPHLAFDQKSFDGRLSGLVTLYRRAGSYEEILQLAGRTIS